MLIGREVRDMRHIGRRCCAGIERLWPRRCGVKPFTDRSSALVIVWDNGMGWLFGVVRLRARRHSDVVWAPERMTGSFLVLAWSDGAYDATVYCMSLILHVASEAFWMASLDHAADRFLLRYCKCSVSYPLQCTADRLRGIKGYNIIPSTSEHAPIEECQCCQRLCSGHDLYHLVYCFD
jgi:hypothetical protein